MRVLAMLALLLAASHAAAQADADPTPVAASVGAGVVLAMGSLAAGSFMLANHEGTKGRKLGAYTILTGFTLTPVLSHAVAGEFWRAAFFGGVGLVVELSAAWLIESTPDLMIEGSLGKRRALGLFYGLSLLNAGLGLFDSLGGGERARPASFGVAPRFGKGELGIGIGGLL